jgi:predicted ATPase/DNA-binding CsgD family transcriptional regulator
MRDDEEMARFGARPFVGRGAELARLDSLLASAESGQPGFAVISGDAGVGKTRLLEELEIRAAAAGHTVLIGSCVQVGDFGLPYLPIIDALRAVEASEAGAALLEAEVVRRPALSRLLPQLVGAGAPTLAQLPTSANQPGQLGQFGEGLAQVQLFEAVHGILLALAEQAPVLLVVEDLHWADRSTRDLLAFLARTLRIGRITIVASYRSDDVHRRHPLRPLLADLARRPDIERIELAPFSRAEIAELLAGVASDAIDPQLFERVFSRSEGNAFFAEELMRAAAGGAGLRRDPSGLPVALADVLLTRTEALSASARTVLRLTAVAGRRASHDLLVEAAESTPAQTEEALRESIEAGLLVSDGDTYAFRHALLQEAVYGDLLPGERVRLHGRFAELLAKANVSERWGSGVRTAELAHHRLASHDLEGAFEALVEAAEQAESVAAPAEALRHLEQALELVPRLGGAPPIDLLERAADAAAAVSDLDRAVAHAEASVVAADQIGDPGVRSRVNERLARLQLEAGVPAADAAAAAVAVLPEAPTQARAQALATWARTIMRAEPLHADQLLSEAIAVADQIGAGAIAADALVTRGLMVRRGEIEGHVGELFAEAIRRAAADAACGLSSHMRALRFSAVQLLESGQIDAALHAADAGVALSTKAGLNWSSYGLDLRLLRGWALSAVGRWDEVLRASLDAAYAPTSPGRVLATQALGVLVARGDPAADGLLERLRGTGDWWAELQLDLCEINLLLQRGQPAAALTIAEAVLPTIPHHGETEALLLGARASTALARLASAARLAGDASAADGYAVRAARYAQVAGDELAPRDGAMPAIALWVAWAAAEVLCAEGRPSAKAWADVVELAEAAGRVEDIAVASLRQAEAALDAGDRGRDTVAALQRAIELATRLEARPLLAVAEEIVRRSRLDAEVGLPSSGLAVAPRGQLSGATTSALTPREVEVLELLGQGLSNRQIGKALFISEKTASVHVSNIIGKLDAASRTEAVVVARRRGVLGG